MRPQNPRTSAVTNKLLKLLHKRVQVVFIGATPVSGWVAKVDHRDKTFSVVYKGPATATHFVEDVARVSLKKGHERITFKLL